MTTALQKTFDRFLCVAFVFAIACTAFAVECRAQMSAQSLTRVEYRERVERLSVTLESLAAVEREAAAAAKGEDWARSETIDVLAELRQKTLREVRELLPEKLQVALEKGGTVEVDNGWLHFQLGRYEAQPASADDVRAEDLEAAAARLRALGVRLRENEEIEYLKRDKEAEKARLAEILRGRDFAERGAQGNALEQLLESVGRWLRELFPSWGVPRPGSNPVASRAAQIVIYTLGVLTIVLVAWAYLRRRKNSVKKPKARREPRVVLGERLEPEETAADILADAEALARRGDLRGAIRKAYIALLCELGDRHIIKLAQHKTNRDYLSAVRESAPRSYDLFRPLTFNFERHWYGLEEANETDWNDFRAGCRRALDVK